MFFFARLLQGRTCDVIYKALIDAVFSSRLVAGVQEFAHLVFVSDGYECCGSNDTQLWVSINV